jgi:hypothetical protein
VFSVHLYLPSPTSLTCLPHLPPSPASLIYQVMVATMSSEEVQLDETISTCRFAQRVALISNRLELNEEVDPKLLIARLKAEV